MFVMYNYLIDISFMISAQGIFEKGNKCATGAIIFYPIGFFLTFVVLPLLMLIKITPKRAKTKK